MNTDTYRGAHPEFFTGGGANAKVRYVIYVWFQKLFYKNNVINIA